MCQRECVRQAEKIPQFTGGEAGVLRLFAQVNHGPREPLFGHLSLEYTLLNSAYEKEKHTHIDMKLHISQVSDRLIQAHCVCFLTCCKETIDVHSLLLSISPHSSHGLEREKFQGRISQMCTAPSGGNV